VQVAVEALARLLRQALQLLLLLLMQRRLQVMAMMMHVV
jgi:hypothetical protein